MLHRLSFLFMMIAASSAFSAQQFLDGRVNQLLIDDVRYSWRFISDFPSSWRVNRQVGY